MMPIFGLLIIVLILALYVAFCIWQVRMTAAQDRDLNHKERLEAMKHGHYINIMGVQHVRLLRTIGVATVYIGGFGLITVLLVIREVVQGQLRLAIFLIVLVSYLVTLSYITISIFTRLNRINPEPGDPLNRAGEVNEQEIHDSEQDA